MAQFTSPDRNGLINAYGRAISFFSQLFGGKSYYVRKLESERKKLQKKDRLDRKDLEEAQKVLEEAQEVEAKVSELESEATSRHNNAWHNLYSVENELERRRGRTLWEQIKENLTDWDHVSSQNLVNSVPELRRVSSGTEKLSEQAKNLLKRAAGETQVHTNKHKAIQSKIVANERKLDMHDHVFNITQKISEIASSHGTTEERLFISSGQPMQNVMLGKYTLDDVESIIEWSKRNSQLNKTAKPEDLATFEFINRIVIPRLDYFVTQALITGDKALEVSAITHPRISNEALFPYSTERLKEEIEEDRERTTPRPAKSMDFGFLMDESQGTHFERLNRAMAMIDSNIDSANGAFSIITKAVADILEEIEKSVDGKAELIMQHSAGLRENKAIERRQREMTIMGQARIDAAQSGNDIRSKATLWQSATYYLSKWAKGLPGEGIIEHIAEAAGHPNIGNMQAYSKANMASAMVQHQAQNKLIELIETYKVDVPAIEADIKKLDDLVETLRGDVSFKELQKDETKQRALSEAFVNKHILSYGQRVSETLRDMCKPSTIDAFLEEFQKDKRLHSALQNLTFGFADSNDLSILLAEANELKGPQKGNKAVFKEFIEEYLKPNIADFYAHGSQIDLIYQSNMTGLGNSLHAARSMIRGSYDLRIGALFSDGFGIESEMSKLTVRGALDVHNLFDYYMHRHGDDDMITDVKLRDGKVTGEWVKRRVSVLSEDEIKTHTRLAKTANSFRQTGPEISDMFLRICGYEYFYPQAYNNASKSNIMLNPEAPAAYVMANAVINNFIERLSLSPIDQYRSKVGGKLDSLMAATLMDFFAELGSRHAADPQLGGKRAEIKSASKETGTFGFVFDAYARQITKDATSQFDLFLKLYERNLTKQLVTHTEDDKQMLLDQINAVHDITKGVLSPNPDMLDGEKVLHSARVKNHTFENTTWGSSLDRG